MTKSIFDNNGFVLLDCQKGNLHCEFILNNGFCKGVTTSENYHFHSSYEIHVPVSGNLHILIEDKDIFLQPGMVCIIPPNSVHYVFGDETAFRISYRFNFSGLGNGVDNYFSLFEQAYGSIKDVCIAEKCMVYQKYLSVAVDNLLNSMPQFMVTELLFLAGCDIAFSVNKVYDVSAYCNSGYSYPLIAENIEEFFNNHYNQTVCLTELADYLNFSKRHTERIMQKLFDMSFIEMLNKKRLVTAKLLLKITDMSISEIAQQLGYQDQNYFYRKFSAAFDITPGKYRILCRKYKTDKMNEN